jgi:hypothetical protein
MRDLNLATKRAIELSKRKQRDYFVVYSKNEEDIPGNDYHVASDYDIEAWFCGCQILFATEDYYATI